MNRAISLVSIVLLASLLGFGCGGGTPEETNTAANEPAPEPAPTPDEPVASPPAPEPPPPPAPPPEPPVISSEQAFEGLNPAPPAAWLTCEADADCAVVEVGCCDHCNDGRVVSVVTKQSKAARTRYRPRRCPDPCTERGCAAAEPVCVEGKCAHRAMWMVPATGEAAPAPAAPAPAPATP